MNTLSTLLLRSLFSSVLMSLAMPVSAVLITVGPDGDCNFNDPAIALFAAKINGTADDEIRVMAGIYQNVRLDSSDISYSLTGGYNHCRLGAQVIGRTSLSGDFTNPVMRIEGAVSAFHNVRLAHLNISNGGSPGISSVSGGIDADDVRLVLENVSVINNESGGYGGGISMRRSVNAVTAILELWRGVRVADNTGDLGGGIYVERGSLRIRPDAVEISSNSATRGGGIAIQQGDLTVGSFGLPETTQTAGGLMINDNAAATLGGGLLGIDSLLDLRESAFVRNRAAQGGGGIYAARGNLQVGRDSMGPGIYCPAGVLCSRFEGNSAGADCPRSLGNGGAIVADAARSFINQTAFIGNCAYDGAAIFVSSGNGDPATDIEGIIAYYNVNSQQSTPIVGGLVAPLRIHYSTLVRNFGRVFSQSGQTDLLVPPVVPLAAGAAASHVRASIIDTGLPTGWTIGAADCNLQNADVLINFRDIVNGDLRLAPTSPAIDRCATAVAPIEHLDIQRSQRCVDSPQHASGNGDCDVGAYEFFATPFDYGFSNSFE